MSTTHLSPAPQPGPSAPVANVSRLASIYLAGCVVMTVYLAITAEDTTIDDWVAFGMLALSTLSAGWLWCRHPARFGFPLWPAVTVPAFAAYAVPLVSGQSNVLIYDIEARFTATALLSLHFLAGTLTWLAMARRPLPRDRAVATLRFVDDPRSPVVLALPAMLFELNRQFGWMNLGELYPVLRTATMGLFLIGTYLFGSMQSRQIPRMFRLLFWLIFWIYGLTTLLTLYLLPLVSALMVMVVALVAGQQRIPWRFLVFTGVLVTILQEGKGDMRQEVIRHGADISTIDGIEEFFIRWVDYSWLRMSTGHAYYSRAEQYSGALDRVNLLHLTIRTVTDAPDRVPYLWGATYAQIPSVLAPRFLVPDKPWSLVGTHMLNIHYGIQTADQVYDTTIGWGLINESHANFGVVGMLLLGMVLGAATGSLGRRTRGLPATSMPTLFAFSLIPILTNTEMTATVLAATLFQQSVVFLGLFLLLTKRQRVREPTHAGQA